MKWIFGLAAVAVTAALGGGIARAEVSSLKITKQPGLMYLQIVLLEEKKLLEKHAALQGLPELKAEWVMLSSGGAATDALLAGSVDIVTSGVSNMLLLWGKTNGEVKAVNAVGGMPFMLVTRNPNVKSLKDFTVTDRIAVPTIRVSMQSITLAIALDKLYNGEPGAHEKLLANQVQMGHPDAMAALLTPPNEVNTHFGNPPYQEMELKDPRMHVVLNSIDALGGPAHVTVSFATTKFHDANPKTLKAYLAAIDEASEIIVKDPLAAAKSYLALNKEKFTAEELAAIISQKGAIYQAAPVRTMVYAEAMNKFGYVKKKVTGWKEYFFAELHGRDGS